MVKGMLHLHTTIVVLFIAFYLYKTILLLIGNNEKLENLRSKTKIVDMILGMLVLATGSFVLFKHPNPESWMYVKLGLVILSIPMGIIGFKKSNKGLVVMVAALYIYLVGVSYTNSLTFSQPKAIEVKLDQTGETATSQNQDSTKLSNEEIVAIKGKVIYEQVCVACHGPEGNLGAGGAANLQTSALTIAEKVNIITNGKGLMASYKGQLSDTDIEAVAKYLDNLKK